MPTHDYKPPTSAEELLERYAKGERLFEDVVLRDVDLSGAKLAGIALPLADLSGARLHGVDLSHSLLRDADLGGCDLGTGYFHETDLTSAVLEYADLSEAYLRRANLSFTSLDYADLRQASLDSTLLIDADLSLAKNLDQVRHRAGSYVDAATLARAQNLPKVFLRGVGLADWQIEEAQLLQLDLVPSEITDIMYRVVGLRAAHPLQIRPIFISYRHLDAAFVDVLEGELNGVGIRFWRDIHDMDAGPMEEQVERAQEDRVTVVVLSSSSTQSDWVEHEVRRARELGKKQARHTLCPIALDDSWKTCAWPERLREQLTEFNILDFSMWQTDRNRFAEQFAKLERGLRKWYR